MEVEVRGFIHVATGRKGRCTDDCFLCEEGRVEGKVTGSRGGQRRSKIAMAEREE
jgi:hypothetical protein